MKSRLVLSLFLILLFTACKKNHNTPTQKVSLPYDTLFEGSDVVVPLISVDASGVFIARKVTSAIDSLIPSTFYSAEAYFSHPSDSEWEYIPAGSVSLNAINIPSTQKLYIVPFIYSMIYYARDSVSLWSGSGPNTWQVSGNADVPAFTATSNILFPDFDTSIVPNSLPLDSSLKITFNTSNTTNATYAYILLQNGDTYKSQDVSATGGTISLSSSLMTTETRFIHDVYIDVVVYNIQYQYFGGKRFAFITQRSCIKKLHFY